MYRVLGITDEFTTCEQCGKRGLKRTVVLESDTTGIVRYGTDCAAAALLGSKSRANRDTVDRIARAHQYARKWLPIRPVALVANAINVRFCPAYAVEDRLFINHAEFAA